MAGESKPLAVADYFRLANAVSADLGNAEAFEELRKFLVAQGRFELLAKWLEARVSAIDPMVGQW